MFCSTCRRRLTIIGAAIALALPCASGVAQIPEEFDISDHAKKSLHGDHEITAGFGMGSLHAWEDLKDPFSPVFFIGYGYEIFNWISASLNLSYLSVTQDDGLQSTDAARWDRCWLGMVKCDMYFQRSESIALYASIAGGAVLIERLSSSSSFRSHNDVSGTFHVTLLGILLGDSRLNLKIELGFGSLGIAQTGLALRL